MFKKMLSASIVMAAVALASGGVFAQEPPTAPAPGATAPQMPATPSMDQKGSGDMSKPAGAEKPMAAPMAKAPMKSGAMKSGAMKKGMMKKSMSKKHMTKKHMSKKHMTMKKHMMMKKHATKKKMM